MKMNPDEKGQSTVEILGYPTSNDSLDRISDQIIHSIVHGGNTRWLACLNPHSIVKAESDPVFKQSLQSADILLPDGVGIYMASRLLKLPLPGKISGSDLFRACSSMADRHKGIRCFFLGSSPEVLERISRRMELEYPNITVCGTYSPPFKNEFSEEDNDKMVEAIQAAKPHILWVGMTAPKQEKWIFQNKDRLNVPFTGAIGAVFDFFAGTKKRSSDFWIRLGLEWLPRFLKEPRRLWERNIISTPVFLGSVLRELICKIKGKTNARPV